MKSRIIILLTLASFALSTEAMAVKLVPKVERQEQKDTQGSGTQTPDKNPPSTPSVTPEKRRESAPAPKEPERRQTDSKEKFKERDRFIDEDDDGINDRLKKAPETIKKKKEDSSKTEKSTKSRRTR